MKKNNLLSIIDPQVRKHFFLGLEASGFVGVEDVDSGVFGNRDGDLAGVCHKCGDIGASLLDDGIDSVLFRIRRKETLTLDRRQSIADYEFRLHGLVTGLKQLPARADRISHGNHIDLVCLRSDYKIELAFLAEMLSLDSPGFLLLELHRTQIMDEITGESLNLQPLESHMLLSGH